MIDHLSMAVCVTKVYGLTLAEVQRGGWAFFGTTIRLHLAIAKKLQEYAVR